MRGTKLQPVETHSSGPAAIAIPASRRPWWLLFWAALPLVMWLALRNAPPGQLWASLARLTPANILLLLALNLFILLLFNLRWWLILCAKGRRVPFWQLVLYRLAGFGVTYFTPGPQVGGEPLQVYLLQRREAVPATLAIASVTLDRLLELLANFTFLLVGAGVILASGVVAFKSGYGLLLLPVGLLLLPAAYLAAIWRGAAPASGLVSRLAKRFPSLKRLEHLPSLLNSAELEMGGFFREHPGTILAALALSFFTWGLLVLEFGLALRMLGLGVGLPGVLVALTAARLAILLPVPAGLGTLEAGQALAMGLIGASPAVGLSLSLVIRARDVLLASLGLWLGGWLAR